MSRGVQGSLKPSAASVTMPSVKEPRRASLLKQAQEHIRAQDAEIARIQQSQFDWTQRAMHYAEECSQLKDAIRWALGETNDFPPREPGQGAFWWRTELRRRSGLTFTPPNTQ
jgi:hypothetical protein